MYSLNSDILPMDDLVVNKFSIAAALSDLRVPKSWRRNIKQLSFGLQIATLVKRQN